MLLPPECRSREEGAVKFPRGALRNQLSAARLIEKVQLTASMSEIEVRREICSTFAAPMAEDKVEDCQFPFEFLQSTKQGSCALCIPSVSPLFTWTGKKVASLSKQGSILV